MMRELLEYFIIPLVILILAYDILYMLYQHAMRRKK